MTETTVSQDFADNHSSGRVFLWRELGIFTMLVSEVLLFAPWIYVFRYPDQPALLWIITLLVAVSIGTMMTRRWLKSRRIAFALVQFLAIAVLPLSILLVIHVLLYQDMAFGRLTLLRLGRAFAGLAQGIPIEVSLTVLTIHAWARGVRAALRGMTDLARTGGLIRFGLFSFLVLLLTVGESWGSLRWLLTLYIFSSLLSIALSRTDLIARSHLHFKLPIHSGWLRGIFVLTLLTVSIGILGGMLLETDAAAGVADLFSSLLRFFVRILELVLSPVIYFFGLLFSLLLRWLSPKINPENMFSPEEGMDSDILGMPFGDTMLGQEGTLSPEFVTGLAVVSILMVAVMVMWGLRRRSLQDNGADNEIEGIEESGSLKAELKRFYNQLRGRLGSITNRHGIRRFLVESSIRRIYAQLLRFSVRFNVERVKSETPFEFQRRLLRVAPHLAEDVREITNAYVEVRYGEFPEDPEAIRAVRTAWDNVRSFR
ncbi:MAG: DUF4129 domain-containing protein [Anaerolineales bacterium]|nr:DUF4129 domain-containing protein [Anaerolineales bacterium]